MRSREQRRSREPFLRLVECVSAIQITHPRKHAVVVWSMVVPVEQLQWSSLILECNAKLVIVNVVIILMAVSNCLNVKTATVRNKVYVNVTLDVVIVLLVSRQQQDSLLIMEKQTGTDIEKLSLHF